MNLVFYKSLHPHINYMIQRAHHKAWRTLDNCTTAGDNAAHARELCQVSEQWYLYGNLLFNCILLPSLMATNAARYRMVAGKHVKLLEFGLRRAQGPDGGLSASKYSYTGTETTTILPWQLRSNVCDMDIYLYSFSALPNCMHLARNQLKDRPQKRPTWKIASILPSHWSMQRNLGLG